MARRLVVLIAVLTAVGALVGVLVAPLAFGASQSKSDRFIEHLDAHNVRYESRDSMLKLADTVCDLDEQGVNTLEYLETAFSKKDAYAIQNGVLNGGYCE
jgi:hypothetical protein